MSEKTRQWRLETDLLDCGEADKFGDMVYANKSLIKRLIKQDIEIDRGFKFKNFKLKRLK